IKIPENCVSRVRAELSRMDEEVKKARREREQFANDQRLRQEMLAKMLNTRKLIPNPSHTLQNHLHYPRSLLPPAAKPKSEAVSEILDLTISPCPSPDIKTPAADLNGVRGRPCATLPETFDLENLISQEQQRQVVLNPNMRMLSTHVPQQHVHTLKQNHSSFGVLTQQQQQQQQSGSRAQPPVQYSTLLSQLHRGQDKSLMLRLLTQMRQQSGASPQSSHVTLPPHVTHASNAHFLGVPKQPAQQAQPQAMQSHVAPATTERTNDEFDFEDLDFSYPSPDSLQYPFTSQALSSSTPPPPPYSSSLFASAPTSSSLSDSSSSSSHFTPSSSSSEQTHLLPNGHSSMDALETLDHMILGTPSDHRQSVI
ncbi:hypothetical protein M9458_005035, partial [Cirrhinus mrigala]